MTDVCALVSSLWQQGINDLEAKVEDFLTKAVEDAVCERSFAHSMRAPPPSAAGRKRTCAFRRALSFEQLQPS